ncbi:hypothetical protein [Phocaeicola vulgatus]|uniref:hypothetical protein n=1 Tax=Phocaeicola vulgatus TaxID=821 RepID=UPI002165A7A2|nr:hypothetical protein [Phocaeicola vulgatus]
MMVRSSETRVRTYCRYRLAIQCFNCWCAADTEDPESLAWVLTIPQTEFDGNPNMDPSKDQNLIGDHVNSINL